MSENELVKVLDSLRLEAIRNTSMSATEAQHKYLLAINYARQMLEYLNDKKPLETLIQITEPFVTTRDNNSNNVYVFCNNVLEIWTKDKK